MIPGNHLSSTPVPAPFPIPVKGPLDYLRGWSFGGVAISDPSQGLMVKTWYGEVRQNTEPGVQDIFVWADDVEPILQFSGISISEMDLTFDQNMNPFIAYKESGLWKYWWYDPLIEGMNHTILPNSRDLKCCFDDPRLFNIASSDIILSYVNDSNELCVRYERDRYTIEYVMASGIVENLIYAERNNDNRIQFGFGYN